jgi:hypothetical protein
MTDPIHDLIIRHQSENKPIRFTDFTHLKPGKYYRLGGLGPSNIGTDEWMRAKERQKNVNNYVNSLQ